MFSVLIFGLLNLGLLQGAKFRRLSDNNCIRLIAQFGSRGNILDRNGEIIVGNKISYDVMILPQDLNHIDQALILIGRILGVEVKELKVAFKKNFISSSVPVTVATNIKLKDAISLGDHKIEQPSIIVTPKPLRYYPYGALAAHVVGYVNEIDRWRLTKLEDYVYSSAIDYAGGKGLLDIFVNE